MTPNLSSLAARIHDFIRVDADVRDEFHSSQFETLSLELFAFHLAHNEAYRALLGPTGVHPRMIQRWSEIPAAPTTAFKEMDLTCLTPLERMKVFHSSGTTGQRPSRHFHNAESLAVYESSLEAWFKANVLRARDERPRFLFLTPPSAEAPHSSLVHMFETLQETCGSANSLFAGHTDVMGAWSIDFDAARAMLDESQSHGRPLVVLGTAFNFVHLLDALAGNGMRFALPPGSRVMETGGYKDRSRTLAETELHRVITETLGVPSAAIMREYGMSELSSQAYSGGIQRMEPRASTTECFRFPPWARFQIISPESGGLAPDGQPGLLRVFDLANVASVLAVQTQDLAIGYGDGFELLGRAALAEPRGCSLMSP